MNKTELRTKLRAGGIREDAYSIDGGYPSEAYVLSHTGNRWRVYYSERGAESAAVDFSSESEACTYFLALVMRDLSTRS